tara:strand:+ start:96 stop:1178 length:1083 start_codon:yes stop_codon:yes gene_type:complete
MKNYLFRVRVSNKIGYGHIKRCLSIANTVTNLGNKATIIIEKNDFSVKLADKYPLFIWNYLSSNMTLKKEVNLLNQINNGKENYDILIIDISNSELYKEGKYFSNYISRMRELAKKIAVIDGFMDQCFSSKFNLDADFIILPYMDAHHQGVVASNAKLIIGEKYFILDQKFLDSSRKNYINKSVKSILLTFGGSDPKEITAKVIEEINTIDQQKLRINIIIGAGFSRDLMKKVNNLISLSNHEYEIINQPDSIAEYINHSDLVVSSTGLTKYEIAFLGIPSIQISIDSQHSLYNIPFSKKEISYDLGPVQELENGDIKKSFLKVFNDFDLRNKMSKKGKELIDGKGVSRLISILETSHAI